MVWQVRLGDRMPEKRLPVIVFALATAVVAYAIGFYLGILLGPIVVFMSTAELFLPIKYRIDQEQVSSKIGVSLTAMRWENVRRTIPVEGGIRLSPLESPSRLDAFRGVLLRFSGNEDAVLVKIAELTQRDGRTLDGTADSRGGDEAHRESDLGDQAPKA